ncbi:metallophosphoesterase [Novosphingobium sp.]|uniref:metallophosphoesterase n=1 Tax=Novosphingobium sp. TaxID=1874826 RepID=UPI0038BD09B4
MVLIAQITDLHLGFPDGCAGESNRLRLDRTLAALVALDPLPDLLLATGDLSEFGDRQSYEHLRDVLAGLPFPVHFALGNHDQRAAFHAAFPEAPFAEGFLHYAIETPALRLLVLDTLEIDRHGGGFCEVRAARLTARLDEAPDKPTLIVQHHPPIEVGIAWMNTDPAEPWVERLASCLRGRANVVGLICGHLHRAIAAHWEGLTVTVCPATAPQVALDLRAIDPAHPDARAMIVADPPGFALHWWNGRQIVTHWQTCEAHEVLARFDVQRQPLIERLLAERPALT